MDKTVPVTINWLPSKSLDGENNISNPQLKQEDYQKIGNALQQEEYAQVSDEHQTSAVDAQKVYHEVPQQSIHSTVADVQPAQESLPAPSVAPVKLTSQVSQERSSASKPAVPKPTENVSQRLTVRSAPVNAAKPSTQAAEQSSSWMAPLLFGIGGFILGSVISVSGGDDSGLLFLLLDNHLLDRIPQTMWGGRRALLPVVLVCSDASQWNQIEITCE